MSARDDLPIAAVLERLDDDATRQLLVAAAEQHETVAQAVRLAAADDDDRLAVLRAATPSRLLGVVGLGGDAAVSSNAGLVTWVHQRLAAGCVLGAAAAVPPLHGAPTPWGGWPGNGRAAVSHRRRSPAVERCGLLTGVDVVVAVEAGAYRDATADGPD